MALLSEDQKLLRRILDSGHRLERLWPLQAKSLDPQASDELTHAPSSEALEALEGLRALILSCAQAPSPDLRRLAFHDRDLRPTMTARHLSTVLVPFERLASRALRDDEFLVAESDRTNTEHAPGPMIVIADNIRSAFNVGAIFRTSECFGAERIWLTGYTATPNEDKTARTSMGVERNIAWAPFAKAADAIREAKARGYEVVALETVEGAKNLGDFKWPERSALLLGNERFGIDRELIAQADHIVRIPLYGRKNSLNVGIAFGIALANWREQHAHQSAAQKPAASETAEKPNSSEALMPQTGVSSPPIAPIGFFHSPARYPYEARRQGVADQSQAEGWVELDPGRQFEQALDDLTGFSRIWLVYRFHHNDNWKPKVMPPRGPRVKRGVFATRSPYRPTPIGISCVELVRIEGRRVFVRGFDLLDGTPVYDIKPYLPYADSFPDARAGWLEGVNDDRYDVGFSQEAETQLRWLEEHGVGQMRGFLVAQLEYSPLDEERKRVTPAREPGSLHRLAYRTWRADFSMTECDRQVTVEKILSGYSPDELQEPSDPYQEKSLHRAFVSRRFP